MFWISHRLAVQLVLFALAQTLTYGCGGETGSDSTVVGAGGGQPDGADENTSANDASIEALDQSKQHALAPVLEPPSGAACSGELDVSIFSPTPGTDVYYTVDGSEPNASKPLFSSPLTVTGNTTIRALALDPVGDYLPSPISSASYACFPQAAAPSFYPPAGKYQGSQTIAVASATVGAVIHYTTDGAEPTGASTIYAAPITLQATTTLRAIARAAGHSDSMIATGIYEIQALPQAAGPTFSPPPGTYSSCSVEVTLSTTTPDAGIRYTTDGTDPDEASNLYNSPIELKSPGVVKARTYAPNYSPSLVAKGIYQGVGSLVSTAIPVFSPQTGTYCNSVEITLTTIQPSGTIVYTLDGSKPTEKNGTTYTTPFTLTTSATVKATTIADGYCTCNWVTEEYTIVSCSDQ